MKHLEDMPDVMPVPQVAKFLGISSGTCYAMIAQGRIPAKKFGRRVLVSKRELAAYLGYEGNQEITKAPKVPPQVVGEIAELARSMAVTVERLARLCEAIGDELNGKGERAGPDAQAARNFRPTGTAALP